MREASSNILASQHKVPAHKFYLIGIGKDQEVASNSTAAGRAQNRRVEIQLLSNVTGQQPTGPQTSELSAPAQHQNGARVTALKPCGGTNTGNRNAERGQRLHICPLFFVLFLLRNKRRAQLPIPNP